MYKRVIHSILSFSLVIVFLLPTGLQFAHSFHEHQSQKSCNAQGIERHIHKSYDENCSFLHKNVNPDLESFFYQYQENTHVHLPRKQSDTTTNTDKQFFPFAKLRAPPLDII